MHSIIRPLILEIFLPCRNNIYMGIFFFLVFERKPWYIKGCLYSLIPHKVRIFIRKHGLVLHFEVLLICKHCVLDWLLCYFWKWFSKSKVFDRLLFSRHLWNSTFILQFLFCICFVLNSKECLSVMMSFSFAFQNLLVSFLYYFYHIIIEKRL